LTWNVLVVAIFHATAPPRRWECNLSSKSSKSFRHVDRPEKCILHAAKLIKNAILKVHAGGSQESKVLAECTYTQNEDSGMPILELHDPDTYQVGRRERRIER